jgi:hypothetical protein
LQSKNISYQSKDNCFEWNFKWNSLYDARLDSNVARISVEEIKMAKTRNQAKAMDSDHEQVAKVKLMASKDLEVSCLSLPRKTMDCI